MEGVEGLLQNLKLTEAEKKGVQIGGPGSRRMAVAAVQTVGKLMAEKPVPAEAVEQALGRVWCPIKGIDCKDLGGNFFLFTFHQSSGKRKALDDGPWVIEKDLMVVADFDGSQTLDEINFTSIPIWIRVEKLPLGMMDRVTGEAIGDTVGEFLEVDLEERHSDVGYFLRIKVRIDIRKPLMRGVMVSPGEGMADKWCPLVYEFLPDFCYVCGIIGHIDRTCDKKLPKGELPQWGKNLRYIPAKRRGNYDAGDRFYGSRMSPHWKSYGYGGKSGYRGSGRGFSSGLASDAPSWRKEDGNARSSLKPADMPKDTVMARKQTEQTRVTDAVVTGGKGVREKEVLDGEKGKQVEMGEDHVNSPMRDMHVDEHVSKKQVQVPVVDTGRQNKKGGGNKGTFKRINRTSEGAGNVANQSILGDKRGRDEEMNDFEEVEREGCRKMRVTNLSMVNTTFEAGLDAQPCVRK
ncbi:unnamed protein product [Urochloa humidicola]